MSRRVFGQDLHGSASLHVSCVLDLDQACSTDASSAGVKNNSCRKAEKFVLNDFFSRTVCISKAEFLISITFQMTFKGLKEVRCSAQTHILQAASRGR